MSVMGMIDTPINSSEERFSFPISFERVYRDYWYKFAEDKELYNTPGKLDQKIVANKIE